MSAPLPLRNHTFLGVTQSLCPDCMAVVPAKILVRDNRVYFRKTCPTHGVREDFVCSDASQYDRMEFSVPGKVPRQVGVDADKGCPLDCGLCTEHEQHTCIGLVELTESCNLKCPLCYSSSGPGGAHQSFEQITKAIQRLIEVEGRPEVLQLSGGEPTIHPEFDRVLDYAVAQPIDIVMLNTNGVRIAHDPGFIDRLARHRKRIEVYLQFDGLRDSTYQALRGEPLAKLKQTAVEKLGQAGIRTILVTTLQAGVNGDEIGDIVKFGLDRPWITGVSFQPATYSGRHVLPEELEQRITFPDVIQGIVEQTDGLFAKADFLPLPCAHPNCHQLTYVYRSHGAVVPLLRFINAQDNLDLLANGITFTRPRARQLIERYLGRLGCCAGGDCGNGETLISLSEAGRVAPIFSSIENTKNGETRPGSQGVAAAAEEFFQRALTEQLDPEDVFRITITSFLDAYNFDVRRVMKCCVHNVLPSGHVIPFCAYNTLYRTGIVPLPELTRMAAEYAT
ncbi:MAG: radical SAM protein [Planctomycetaceae bacterium]|nr:radical SAM protein [Planctomycetaceae bacterium]